MNKKMFPYRPIGYKLCTHQCDCVKIPPEEQVSRKLRIVLRYTKITLRENKTTKTVCDQ